jgi:hypothetical protein
MHFIHNSTGKLLGEKEDLSSRSSDCYRARPERCVRWCRSKIFDVSKRFYIGFQPRPLTDRLVEMQLGASRYRPALRNRAMVLS